MNTVVENYVYRGYVYRKESDGKFYIYMANANENVVGKDEYDIKSLIDFDIEMDNCGYVKGKIFA